MGMTSAEAMRSPARDDDAVLFVLSQPLLLSLIASFQPGVPGVVAPLLRRYVDDQFVRCSKSYAYVGWREWREKHRISTPLCQSIHPKRQWVERVVPEALAKYDGADLRALRVVLNASAFQQNHSRATQRIVHRVSEAAAAFGRVDMLQWLNMQYDLSTVQPRLFSFCGRLAARHGQVDVLAWMETQFGIAALEGLRHYDVRDIAKRGYAATLLWMAMHKLGVLVGSTLRNPIERGDVAVLRVLLDEYADAKPFDKPPGEELVKFAVLNGQLAATEYLVGDKKYGFSKTTLEKAIAARHIEIVKCLLNHRDAVFIRGGLNLSSWLVDRLVGSNDLLMLAMLASVRDSKALGCTVLTCCQFGRPSEDAVRLLLPLSTMEDISVALVRFAVRKKARIVDSILDFAKHELPPDVVAFVGRVMSDSLGPLATLAVGYHPARDNAILDDMLRVFPTASRNDVQDTVLRFLAGPLHLLTAVLKADAKRNLNGGVAFCDEPFLELCLSLRQSERDAVHQGIQSYLKTRKKPRPTNHLAHDTL